MLKGRGRGRGRERERLALAMAVHVTTESLRFAELKRTKPTFVHLLTLFFSFFPAFLFPPTCSKPNPSTFIKTTLQKPFNKLVIINNQLQHKSYTAYLIFPTFFPFWKKYVSYCIGTKKTVLPVSWSDQPLGNLCTESWGNSWQDRKCRELKQATK